MDLEDFGKIPVSTRIPRKPTCRIQSTSTLNLSKRTKPGNKRDSINDELDSDGNFMKTHYSDRSDEELVEHSSPFEDIDLQDQIDGRFGFTRIEHALEPKLGWLINMHASIVPEDVSFAAAVPCECQENEAAAAHERYDQPLFTSEEGYVAPGHASVDFYFLQEVSL
jgi:hypothetical protein